MSDKGFAYFAFCGDIVTVLPQPSGFSMIDAKLLSDMAFSKYTA